MAVRIRAPLACRIARVDRDRLNESISTGFYTCAPETYSGQRIFAVGDVIVLFIYGRLLEFGLSPRYAGRYACMIKERVDAALTLGEDFWISIVKTTSDTHCFVSANIDAEKKGEIGRSHREMVISPLPPSFTDGFVLFTMSWQVSVIRKIVDAAIEDYRNTLGEEEAIG